MRNHPFILAVIAASGLCLSALAQTPTVTNLYNNAVPGFISSNIIAPGDSFGEIALLDGMPRTADATAMMRTELSIIQRDQFLALLGSEPQLARHLIKLLCTRVRWTAQIMEDSALLNVPAKIAKRLLGLAELHGRATADGIKLKISQEELAQFLSVSRQIVNQYLQTWKAKDWIEVGRGSVTVRNTRCLDALIRES